MSSCTSILLFLAINLISLIAQTKDELRQKYGAPDKNGKYTVRRGVLINPSFATSVKILDIDIEPEQSPRINDPEERGLNPETLAMVIDELAPSSLRGNYIRSISFSGGRTLIVEDEYEHVTIQRTSLCKAGEGRIIVSAKIYWEHRIN